MNDVLAEKLPALVGKSVLIKTIYNYTEGGSHGRQRILSRYDDENLYLIRGCDAEPVEVKFELSSVEDISEYIQPARKA